MAKAQRPVAILTLRHDASSKQSREAIAKWMERQAKAIRKEGESYGDYYRARLWGNR